MASPLHQPNGMYRVRVTIAGERYDLGQWPLKEKAQEVLDTFMEASKQQPVAALKEVAAFMQRNGHKECKNRLKVSKPHGNSHVARLEAKIATLEERIKALEDKE